MMPMAPLVVIFGTRAVWTFSDLVGSFCQNTKSVSYIEVMAQPNEPADTTADPLAVLTAALKLLMPNQPATILKTPPLNGQHLTNMMNSSNFESPRRAGSASGNTR